MKKTEETVINTLAKRIQELEAQTGNLIRQRDDTERERERLATQCRNLQDSVDRLMKREKKEAE